MQLWVKKSSRNQPARKKTINQSNSTNHSIQSNHVNFSQPNDFNQPINRFTPPNRTNHSISTYQPIDFDQSAPPHQLTNQPTPPSSTHTTTGKKPRTRFKKPPKKLELPTKIIKTELSSRRKTALGRKNAKKNAKQPPSCPTLRQGGGGGGGGGEGVRHASK